MTTQIAPVPVFKEWDNNGNPLVGGQLFTYVAGTTTPQATWTDATQVTQNPNPIILNSRGEASVWLDTSKVYKLILQDATGNPIWSQDQIPGGYVTSSQIGSLVTQSFIGAQLYPQTAAELAAGATPVQFQYPPGYVDRYGVNTSPGTTNMLAAVTAAFNLAVQAGGAPIVFQPVQYFLGNFSGTGPPNSIVLNIQNLTNTIVYGNGATIVVNTQTNGLLYTVFNVINPINITVIGLHFNDLGFDITQTWKGVRAWVLTAGGSVHVGGVTFLGCTFTNMVAPLYFSWTAGTAGRVRQVHIAGCQGINCYYGPVFADQGDGVTGNWWALNPRRGYFVYGVTGHDFSLNLFYDGSNNGGSNGGVDIKRYQFDTRSLKLRVAYHGNAGAFSPGALVNFETQGNAGTLGISALGTITGGSGYTNGVFPGVPLTGGTGTGALSQITVTGGAVSRVEILNQGAGYLTTDTLSATTANLGGTGSGFSVPVTSIGAFITDVEVDLSLADYVFSPGAYSPIQFNSLQPNGTQNPTTTDVFDQISLRGNFGQWASLNNNPPINVASIMVTRLGHLTIEPALFRNFQNVPQVFYGWVLQTEANKEVYTKNGDLTAAGVFIDLGKYDGRGWSLRVKVSTQLDFTLGSSVASLYDFSLIGHKPRGSAVVIDGTSTVSSNVNTTGSIPTFTAAGNGINVTFSNYNNVNSYLRMEVSHEGAFL